VYDYNVNKASENALNYSDTSTGVHAHTTKLFSRRKGTQSTNLQEAEWFSTFRVCTNADEQVHHNEMTVQLAERMRTLTTNLTRQMLVFNSGLQAI